MRATDVGDKVKAMQAGFRAAEGSALFTTMARALGEQLVKIYPEHKTAPMAADTARAFLALNDFPRAVEWYYTVAGGATIDPQYEAPTVQLWPVLQLADLRILRLQVAQEARELGFVGGHSHEF